MRQEATGSAVVGSEEQRTSGGCRFLLSRDKRRQQLFYTTPDRPSIGELRMADVEPSTSSASSSSGAETSAAAKKHERMKKLRELHTKRVSND